MSWKPNKLIRPTLFATPLDLCIVFKCKLIIIIIVSFRQATLRPIRSCRFAKKEGAIRYGYIGNWNSGTSVFPITRAWKQ